MRQERSLGFNEETIGGKASVTDTARFLEKVSSPDVTDPVRTEGQWWKELYGLRFVCAAQEQRRLMLSFKVETLGDQSTKKLLYCVSRWAGLGKPPKSPYLFTYLFMV